VPKLNSPKYVYGMALWVAAELGFDIPTDTAQSNDSVVENRKHWKAFRAQDLGLILIGCVEQARRGSWPMGIDGS